MADVHVVPDGDRWKIEHDGTGVDTFDTQADAIAAARSVAEDEQCELVIHGQDGQIREKDSHGNDPRDVPG
jgi:hydroxyethylthiazole kinase-like sugar kinase family protein